MSETTMRITADLKEQLETLKTQFYAKTAYNVIEGLIRQNEAFNRYRQEQVQKAEAEKQRQQEETINAGRDMKGKFQAFKDEYGLRTDAAALAFLLDHFETSPTISKSTLSLYRNLR